MVGLDAPQRWPVQQTLGLFLVFVSFGKWRIEVALATALGSGILWWLIEHFTAFKDHFQVVYIVPLAASAAADAGVDPVLTDDCNAIAAGCKVREMPAVTSTLDKHLAERNLAPIECPTFDKAGRDWVLYGRRASSEQAAGGPSGGAALHRGDQSQSGKKKAPANKLASVLAGMELSGHAAIVPRDRAWRPKGYGKLDWMSGNAQKRIDVETLKMTVSLKAVLELFTSLGDCAIAKDGDCATSGCNAAALLETTFLAGVADENQSKTVQRCKAAVSGAMTPNSDT